MRLIDADEVQKRIDLVGTVNGILCWDAHDFIDHVPTIEAEPVRHGRWKPIGARLCGGNTDSFQCSECEFLARALKAGKECGYDFCPNCGARMDGEKHAQDEHAGDAERVSG